MVERVACNSSARVESDTLTTVASIWARNEPKIATDEICQSLGPADAALLGGSTPGTRLLGKFAAVESAEMMGGQQAHHQEADANRGHIGV